MWWAGSLVEPQVRWPVWAARAAACRTPLAPKRVSRNRAFARRDSLTSAGTGGWIVWQAAGRTRESPNAHIRQPMRKLTDKGRAAPSSILETSRPARHPQGLELDVLAAWVTASPDGVLVLDSDLRVVYASPAYCALFDLQSDRVLGQDLLRFVPEQHRQTALAHWADVRDGRSESIGFRVDGSELELEVRGTVLDLQRNRFLVLSFRDVTERQRQARQAAALAQA